MIQINITNKTAYTLIFTLALLTTGIVVLAYNSGSSPATYGHSAEELEVTIDGTLYTVQEAIDQNILTNKISLGNGTYTVQEAIDQNLLGTIECRVCFKGSDTNVNGQCKGDRNSCSKWSTTPGYTNAYTDDTDDSGGGCNMKWKIECRPVAP